MPTFKVTQFINSNTGLAAGWTESFYTGSGSGLDNVADLYGQQLFGTRLALLHPAYSLIAVRVVNTDFPGVATLRTFTPDVSKGTYPVGTPAGTPEQPFDGVLTQQKCSTGQRRGYIIRGIPKNVINDTYNYVGSSVPAWSGRFDAFRASIYQRVQGDPAPVLPWSMKATTKSAPLVPTALVIQGSGFYFTFTVDTQFVPAVVVGDMIKVTGNKACAWLNGLWKIGGITALQGAQTGFVFRTNPKKRQIRGTANLADPIQIFGLKKGYTPVNFMEAVRGAKRDTGRPFTPLVGKRRVMQG